MTAMTPQPYPSNPPFYGPEAQNIKVQEYLHTPLAGALVPFVQSAITGALVAAIALAVLVKLRVKDWPFWTLIAFLAVTFLVWLFLQRHWFTLTNVEHMTGLDINQDGMIGEQMPRHKVKVDILQEHDGGSTIKTAELPATEADLSVMASGLLSGRPFTEREWTGAGKPLSVNQFRAMRVEMLGRGIIELANQKAPQQGFKLTRSGVAVMRYFAAISPTSDVQVCEMADR